MQIDRCVDRKRHSVPAPGKMGVKGEEEGKDSKKKSGSRCYHSAVSWVGEHLCMDLVSDRVTAPSSSCLESNKSRHNKPPGDFFLLQNCRCAYFLKGS